MREEDNHGGITVGAMGILNRHAQILKMYTDVQKNGEKSKYYKWVRDYREALVSLQDQRIKKYNKSPKWLRWLMKNPNK